uniref:Endonuclease-reverse transcriptase n=1 Tax=Cacopsylla melanoneura TaxID=428564 RepID=A0A8D8ZIG3_9HEMI
MSLLMTLNETWPIKKTQEDKLNVTEMIMPKWMSRVTRRDKIRNTMIRGTVKVVEISWKVQEKRLQWFGHVERRDNTYVGKVVREINVMGKRRKGRPKKRWIDKIHEDLR